MQVSRWGEDLAVKLPVELVEALGLKEGDHVDVAASNSFSFTVKRKITREEASKALEALPRYPIPADYKFDREELHERAWMKRLIVGEKD